MMTKIMYIHGYGSDGNAMKGNLLREMFPECGVVSPTLDYNGRSPRELLEQLRNEVVEQEVKMIVGSSFGGYFGLCCATFYEGPIWLVNPVHHVEETLRRVVFAEGTEERYRLPKEYVELRALRFEQYGEFDRQIFNRIPQREGQLNFALSTDDELLGDHCDLMEMFPKHGKVALMSECGHKFLRFTELKGVIGETIKDIY